MRRRVMYIGDWEIEVKNRWKSSEDKIGEDGGKAKDTEENSELKEKVAEGIKEKDWKRRILFLFLSYLTMAVYCIWDCRRLYTDERLFWMIMIAKWYLGTNVD